MISAKKLLYKVVEKIVAQDTAISSLPTIYKSTSAPTSGDGQNGDVWIKYVN